VETAPQTALARVEPPAQAKAPRKPGAFGRFFGAMGYPWKGMGFVIDHPRLLPLTLAPIATTVTAVLLLFSWAMQLAATLAHHWAGGHGWLGRILFFLIMIFVVVPLGYLAFTAILSLSAAPFCAALSDRVEHLATGRPIPNLGVGGTILEALRGILHALLRLTVYLVISVPLYLIGLFVPPIAPITMMLGMIVTSYFLAYDFLDYPLSSRKKGFAEKWAFVDENRAESLGFGAMVGLLLAIPALNMLVAPFAAVGAALLHVDVEKKRNGA
jgi:CysZ protein